MASYARLLLLVKTVRPFLRATQAVNLTWSVRGRSRGGLLVGFLPPLQVSYSPDRLIENVALHTYHWTCQRCGATQDHQDELRRSYRWAEHRSHQKKASNPLCPRAAL